MNQTGTALRILFDMKARLGLIAAIPLFFALMAAHSGNEIQAGSASAHADPSRVVRVEMLGLKQERLERARSAILAVPGVQSVEFNTAQREARVRFNVETTRMKQLERQIRAAGFTPWFH